jgi:TPR repeat protein
LLALIGVLALMGVAWGQADSGPVDVLRAAQAGDPEAQLEMGILYEYGFNMEGNDVPALAWYMLAAQQGNQRAAQRRDQLMERMSQADIEQALKLSARLQGRTTTAR